MTDEHLQLHRAALKLYLAGRWSCNNKVDDQEAMWEALRDALNLPIGTATEAGVGAK